VLPCPIVRHHGTHVDFGRPKGRYVDDVDATYAKAIEAGATEVRALRDEDHGDRMGGVLDPFGNQWWMASPLAT